MLSPRPCSFLTREPDMPVDERAGHGESVNRLNAVPNKLTEAT